MCHTLRRAHAAAASHSHMLDRLPYEIFRRIIQCANTPDPPCSKTLTSYSYLACQVSSPPIKASHVCRSWRKALLYDPTMWTCFKIREKDKDRTKELLRRSGSALLDVIINTFDGALDAHALAIVLQERHRFRTLQITISVHNDTVKRFVYQILPYFDHPAPRLKRLSISVEGSRWEVDEGFPQILFAGKTPNLKHIHLSLSRGFHKLLSSPLFQNVSEIFLDMSETTVIHGDVLLDTLELSPRLRKFHISPACSEQWIISPTSFGRRVRLSYLQQLLVQSNYGSGVRVADFVLRHLDFPSENIQSHIRCDDFHVKRFYSMSSLLLRFLAQRRYTFLESAAYVGNVHLMFSDPSIDGSVWETKYDITHEPVENIPNFLQTFELSHITHLTWRNTPLKTTSFMSIFTSLVNLQHLCVEHRSADKHESPAESFLMALMLRIAYIPSQTRLDMKSRVDNGPCFQNMDAPQAATPRWDDTRRDNFRHVLCPSLRTLEIIVYWGFQMGEVYIQTVVTCAEFRRQAGYPFKDITIRCSRWILQDEVAECLQRYEGFPITVLAN